LFLVTVKGIDILAPESLPVTVIVVLKLVVEVPNNVSIVVPTKVNDVPIAVLLICVPVLLFTSDTPKFEVSIPMPVNVDNNLASPTVITYPLGSKVDVAPR
jgi:hypothetical protein